MRNMSRLRDRKISMRSVNALSVDEKDVIFWDRDLPGFGVRVYPSGTKAYVVQSRGWGISRRITLGRHGELSTEQARRRAAAIIARIKKGAGPIDRSAPRRAEPTVGGMAQRFLDEHVVVRCKPRTLVLYRSTIDRHVLPGLGKIPISALRREQVAELHHHLRATPYAANRTIEILGQILDMAEERGLRSRGSNPCRTIEKYKERQHERFLSGEEFRRLGRVLNEMAGGGGGASPAAVAALRLLALTGCRRGEILGLRWEHVDFEAGELRLPDSKTGARLVPLSPAAVAVLVRLPRPAGSPWVIPGRKPGSPLKNLQGAWETVKARAGLTDVRIHDLRHSFASRALALGESLPMIGELLGHRRNGTTARYAHLARDSVKASAARVADSIGSDLHPANPWPDTVPMAAPELSQTPEGAAERREGARALEEAGRSGAGFRDGQVAQARDLQPHG